MMPKGIPNIQPEDRVLRLECLKIAAANMPAARLVQFDEISRAEKYFLFVCGKKALSQETEE